MFWRHPLDQLNVSATVPGNTKESLDLKLRLSFMAISQLQLTTCIFHFWMDALKVHIPPYQQKHQHEWPLPKIFRELVAILCDHPKGTYHFSHVVSSPITHWQPSISKQSLQTDLRSSSWGALLMGLMVGRVWHSCRDYPSSKHVLRDYPACAHPWSWADTQVSSES